MRHQAKAPEEGTRVLISHRFSLRVRARPLAVVLETTWTPCAKAARMPQVLRDGAINMPPRLLRLTIFAFVPCPFPPIALLPAETKLTLVHSWQPIVIASNVSH